MYVVLLGVLIILAIISFFVNQKDVLSPSFISCVAYMLCDICAIIGKLSWNNIVISWKVIGIMMIGLLAFICAEFIVRKIYNKKAKKTDKIKEDKILKVEKWKIISSIILIIIEIILMFVEIRRIVVATGFDGNNILEMFSFYRDKSQLFSNELVNKGLKINIIVSQLNKLCTVLGMIYIYIFLKNIINKDKIKNNIVYIIPVILCCVLALMTGSRTQILKYVIATFIMGFILLSKKDSLKILLKKVLIIGTVLLVIILPLFYATLPLLGRKQDKDFIPYMTFYLGTSIPSFESYLNNPPAKSKQFGSESLRGINSLLNKLGIVDEVTPVSREWTKFPGSNYSTVYTAFRRYLQDFGIVGVIVCQFLFGAVFSIIYLYAKNKENGIWLIFYGMYSYMLIDQVRDELFFTTFVHINIFINMFFILVLYWILTKFEFKDLPQYKIKLMNLLKNERKKNANEK